MLPRPAAALFIVVAAAACSLSYGSVLNKLLEPVCSRQYMPGDVRVYMHVHADSVCTRMQIVHVHVDNVCMCLAVPFCSPGSAGRVFGHIFFVIRASDVIMCMCNTFDNARHDFTLA